VPRVTISVDNTRSSAGTRIGAAAGGAVRDACSAGELIWEPATHPTPAASTTAASTMTAILRCPVIVLVQQTRSRLQRDYCGPPEESQPVGAGDPRMSGACLSSSFLSSWLVAPADVTLNLCFHIINVLRGALEVHRRYRALLTLKLRECVLIAACQGGWINAAG